VPIYFTEWVDFLLFQFVKISIFFVVSADKVRSYSSKKKPILQHADGRRKEFSIQHYAISLLGDYFYSGFHRKL
jgi:hypothetical protein